MIIMMLVIVMLISKITSDNENHFGESHFAPRYKFDKTYSEPTEIGIIVLGLEAIEKVKPPGNSFFTSFLASRSNSKAQETWNEISKSAKILKSKYSKLKKPEHTKICYISNVQKALLFLIEELSNSRSKRDTSSTTTTTTTKPSVLDDTVSKFSKVMKVVFLAKDLKETPKSEVAKRMTLYQTINKNLQCWVNNKDYESITDAYKEILTLDNLQYMDKISEKHKTMPISELKEELLGLINLYINRRVTFSLPFPQGNLYDDESACEIEDADLTYDIESNNDDSISNAETLKRTEFCTSTPNLCIGSTPRQIIRHNLQELGLKDSDITLVMLEKSEAEIYRRASFMSARRSITYTNPEKVIYGDVQNINYTIITKQFSGVTKSDDELNDNMTPILRAIKFLDIVYETKFNKKAIQIESDLLNCEHFENLFTFNIKNKIYGFKKETPNLKGYYPMPFCYDYCLILDASPYVIFESNDIGIISMTDTTFQKAFVMTKTSSINVCAKQKTITEACKFKTIQYVQQITLLTIYDYHCTINNGCSFYLEGKIISGAFVSQAEFESLRDKSDLSVIENIFSEEGNEMVIKGIFYSMSTLITIGMLSIMRKCWKYGKSQDWMCLTNCCKDNQSRRENHRRHNIPLNTVNIRPPVVTDPLMS